MKDMKEEAVCYPIMTQEKKQHVEELIVGIPMV